MVNRIFGIGEIVLDVVMRGGKPLAAVPGGSTFNAMTSLGRVCLDKEIYMISETGDDMVSDIITSFMADNNVSSKYVRKIKNSQSTLSIAMLDDRNDAHYEFYRDRTSSGFAFDEIEFRKGDIVIFGSFFALNPKTREETQRLVRKAKQSGAFVYYDVNFRRNHLQQLPDVLSQIKENCMLSDVVRASSDDIFNIFGVSDPDIAYREYMSHICPLFIYTSGAGMTHFYGGKNRRFDYMPEKIETVSTIGAGDNFNAGFVFGYSKYGLNIPVLLEIASQFSSNVCQSIYNYVDRNFKPIINPTLTFSPDFYC